MTELGLPTDDPIGVIPQIQLLPDLDPEKTQKVEALLDEFKDIFSRNSTNLGCIPNQSQVVEVGNSKPICSKTYRISKMEEVQNEAQT